MFSLDTNILIYAVDVDAEVKHTAARKLVDAASTGDAALTEQSIVEFVNVATRKKKLPLAAVMPFAQEFLANFKLLLPSETVVEDVLTLLSRHHISVFDARIIAVCTSHGCNYLLSEDFQDGARYGRMTVVNPFSAANATIIDRLLT